MEVCPTHNQPWKVIPAGVSKKTGRAYPSFKICEVEGCNQRPEYLTNKTETTEAVEPTRGSDTGAQIAMMNSITNAIAFYDPYRSGDMTKDLIALGEIASKFFNKIREAK